MTGELKKIAKILESLIEDCKECPLEHVCNHICPDEWERFFQRKISGYEESAQTSITAEEEASYILLKIRERKKAHKSFVERHKETAADAALLIDELNYII